MSVPWRMTSPIELYNCQGKKLLDGDGMLGCRELLRRTVEKNSNKKECEQAAGVVENSTNSSACEHML